MAFKAELQSKGIFGEYNGAELFMSPVLRQSLQIIGRLVIQEREVQRVLPIPSIQSPWSIAGQPVPIGKLVKITHIGEKDACYHRRDKNIGRAGIVLEAQQYGKWLRGSFRFDAPLLDRGDGRYVFLQFQVA